MLFSRPGGRSSRGLVAGALGRPAALLLAVASTVALGACSASTLSTASSPEWSATLAPGVIAGITPAGPPRPAVEIEGDGIEAQRAPRRRAADKADDDPTEPFSPNYGRAVGPDPVPEPA